VAVNSREQQNQRIVDEFRANEGRVGAEFEGVPLLLLHTTGARSGEPRINPMMYLAENDRLYVFASNGARPNNPGWYYNVLADSHVTVEVGTERFEATATPLTGAERDRVYAEQARRWPIFLGYQDKAERTIPVVALDRLADSSG
jgi:deazaflavin-dependent oxidoreductase (nitroreductase family)